MEAFSQLRFLFSNMYRFVPHHVDKNSRGAEGREEEGKQRKRRKGNGARRGMEKEQT